MAKISVVVPVYKVEDYLDRCINSILNQSFKDFDLILIDDGSPDECGIICDQYASGDSRIVVLHQENQGLAEARNVGIEWSLKNSNSEWITFIDSDDWIHRDYLRLLYETAIECDANLTICNCIKTSNFEENTESNIINCEYTMYNPEGFWCFRQYGGAWAKLYKKEHFREIRYPKGLLYEDVFVTYRLLFMQDKVVYIENPLYFYYIREDSITQSNWNPRVLAQLDGMKEQLSYYNENGFERAFFITVKNYLLDIKKQEEQARAVSDKYPNAFKKLKRMYRMELVKYHKLLPISKYTYMYRYGFPLLTKLYKKYTYLKER